MRRNLPTIVMSDLDSTLFNTEHRHYMADECLMSGDWDEYSRASVDDDLIVGTAATLRLLYPMHQIHLVSGRSEAARDVTEIVLGQFQVPYDKLVMYDRSLWHEKPTNGALKVSYIEDMRNLGYQVVLFLEDWSETAEAIEDVGVPVLCVNPRYKTPLTTHL